MWCVYAHSGNSDSSIFYVGCGTQWRAYEKSSRSNKWKQVVSERGLVVSILKEFKSRDAALRYEKKTIDRLLPVCNKEARKRGEVLGVSYEKSFTLLLTNEQHSIIKHKSIDAGLSMKQYILNLVYGDKKTGIIDMTLDGKINKKPKQ